MEHIKDTLEGLLRRIERKQGGLRDDNPCGALKKILTNKEIQHIKFNYFKKGIVSLSVDNASWMFKLNIRKDDILGQLRKELPGIKDVRFYLGELK